jgi:hypothetical protein
MRRMVLPLFIPVVFMVLLVVSGCVKRVWDAPGLPPGSSRAVSGDMRGETFMVDDLEVRSFMIELSTTNNRRYQFVILSSGVHQYDYFLDRLTDGTFDLVEKRADGISLTRKSYPTEPAYVVVRTDIVDLLKGGK